MLATQPLTSSLYAGFPGIAWAVELVDRLLGAGGEDRNGDIDEALTSLLRRYPGQAPYDLVQGLTGLGVYALARWPRPAAAQCILGVVEQLARQARHDRDGVYWWTPPTWNGLQRERYQPGGVDLGVAHGIAGIIPFLARVHRLGLAQQTVRPLLDGAVGWLLAHMVDTASGPTVPCFVADGVEPGPARSAWCYGDPGVAAALLLAARDVGEPAWAAVATALAMRAAIRPPDQTGVVDAGLCHGSAGLAHLFNRMYQMTAEPALADAARFWVERTLELCSAAAPGPDAALSECRTASMERPRAARRRRRRRARPGGREHHGRTRLGPDAARLHHRNSRSGGAMSGRGTSHPVAAPSGFFVLRTPLLPFTEVIAWGHGLQAPMAADDPGVLDEAVATDRAQLRRRLEDIVTTPEFRDALFVASPSLAAAVDPWRKEPDSDKGRATERSLVSYVMRAAARPTPFGLFAGCTTGTIGERTCMRLEGMGRYRRHTRLDMDYLWALAEAVERDPRPARGTRLPAELQPLPGRRPAAVRRGAAGTGRPVLPARGRGRDAVPDADPRPGAGRRAARHPGRRAGRR